MEFRHCEEGRRPDEAISIVLDEIASLPGSRHLHWHAGASVRHEEHGATRPAVARNDDMN
jgi:hypothetical protein